MKWINCSNQVQSNIFVCFLHKNNPFFFIAALYHTVCMSFQSEFHRNENACKLWRKRVSFTYPVIFFFFHFPFRSFMTILTKLRTKKKCFYVSGDRHVAIVLNEFACTAEQQETSFRGIKKKLLHMLALFLSYLCWKVKRFLSEYGFSLTKDKMEQLEIMNKDIAESRINIKRLSLCGRKTVPKIELEIELKIPNILLLCKKIKNKNPLPNNN